jgi:type I restriction enzyme, S subunit
MGGESRISVVLGDLLDGGTRNGVYKPKEFHGRGAKIINMGELFAHPRLRAIPMKRVELSDDEVAKFAVRPGDLLFARRSLVADGAGKCTIVREVDEPTVFESSIIRARPHPSRADSLFLYYLFGSPKGVHLLDTIRRDAVVAGITGTDLVRLKLELPPLTEQRAVARILGALDDKIDLNRKMNATLEAMARALFKSWFVQEPEADWKTAPLADWVDVLSGGTPSKSNAALWGGPLKWISPKAMTSIHADECDDHVSEQAVGNGTRIAPKGSTLVMVRGMGLHDGVRVSQAREDVSFNQDVKALVPKNIEADLLLFAMLDAQEELHKRVETSGHGTGKMPTEILLAHPITMPSREVQRKHAGHISALNDRIGANRSESRTLARIRDELLPRLLSGELSVAHAEREVEAVA